MLHQKPTVLRQEWKNLYCIYKNISINELTYHDLKMIIWFSCSCLLQCQWHIMVIVEMEWNRQRKCYSAFSQIPLYSSVVWCDNGNEGHENTMIIFKLLNEIILGVLNLFLAKDDLNNWSLDIVINIRSPWLGTSLLVSARLSCLDGYRISSMVKN